MVYSNDCNSQKLKRDTSIFSSSRRVYGIDLFILFNFFFFPGLTATEKKLAEYKCNTNEAIQLKLGNDTF